MGARVGWVPQEYVRFDSWYARAALTVFHPAVQSVAAGRAGLREV